jgi:hypothetical protein
MEIPSPAFPEIKGRHPERRRFSAGAKDLPPSIPCLPEIPPPTGENAGVRDDAVYHRRKFKLNNRHVNQEIGLLSRTGHPPHSDSHPAARDRPEVVCGGRTHTNLNLTGGISSP